MGKIREAAMMAEDALPRAIERALVLFDSCAGCGHTSEKHREGGTCGTMCGCGRFVWSVSMAEALATVKGLAELARHGERMDRDLGLDKQVMPVLIPWAGVDVAKWKMMTQDEQDRLLLERMGGSLAGGGHEVLDVSAGDTPSGLLEAGAEGPSNGTPPSEDAG